MSRQERTAHETAGGPSDEIDLFDYLRVVYKYRWTILVVCFLAAAITGGISFLQRPRYVATASVVPPMELMGGDTRLGLGLLGGAEGALLRKVMDTGSLADMYVGILDSRAVTDAIIDRFDLMHVYSVSGLRYKAARKLRRNTKVDVSKEGIVNVTVEDEDPNRAAAMANAYMEELDGQNKRLSAGQATGKRLFMESRLDEVEQKLQNIENMPAREVQVQEMLYELLVRELEMAKIEEAKSMPTIQILDPAVPPEVRKARGTVTKAVLAGMAALMFMIFVAFGREYLIACRAREQRSCCIDGDSGVPSGSVSETTPTGPQRTRLSESDAPLHRSVPDSIGSARD